MQDLGTRKVQTPGTARDISRMSMYGSTGFGLPGCWQLPKVWGLAVSCRKRGQRFTTPSCSSPQITVEVWPAVLAQQATYLHLLRVQQTVYFGSEVQTVCRWVLAVLGCAYTWCVQQALLKLHAAGTRRASRRMSTAHPAYHNNGYFDILLNMI